MIENTLDFCPYDERRELKCGKLDRWLEFERQVVRGTQKLENRQNKPCDCLADDCMRYKLYRYHLLHPTKFK